MEPFTLPLESVQQFRATAAKWSAMDKILAPNQMGHEEDTGKTKRGDGQTPWPDLPYYNPSGDDAFNSLKNTYANNLVTAVAAIGATPTTLLIDEDTNLAVGVTIPATLTLERKNGAAIVFATNGSMKFEGIGVRGDEQGLFNVSAFPPLLWVNQGQVTLATDTINSAAHGFVTGAQVRYQLVGPTAVAIGNLTADGLYYVIRIDADNIKLASSYANAIAGTAIDLTDGGTETFYLIASPVAWSGTDYASELRTDVFNTGDTSQSKRVEFASAALGGKTALLLVAPGVMTKQTTPSNGHSLRFLPGDHQSTYTQAAFDDRGAYNIGSRSRVDREPGAVFFESDQDFNTRLISSTKGASHSIVQGMHFKGQEALFDGIDGGVAFDDAEFCHILDNFFDNCESYLASFVSTGSAVGATRFCSIQRNILKNTATQILFFAGGEHIDIIDNIVDLFGYAWDATFGIIDIEPNKPVERVKHLRIWGNRFDTREFVSAGVSRFILVQGVNTAGFSDISVRNNRCIANDIGSLLTPNSVHGIEITGAEAVEVDGNYCQGIHQTGIAISLTQCRNGVVSNNVGVSNGLIYIQACNGIIVNNNRAIFVGVGVERGHIDESPELEHPLSGIVGAICTFSYSGYADQKGRIYPFQAGQFVELNTNVFVIDEIDFTSPFDTYRTATLTVAPGYTGSYTVAAADVNTGTNEIGITSHGWLTGAAIHYLKASGAIGGLGNGSTYYWISTGANTGKIAASYADALAGTAIDLTSAGTDGHVFQLCLTEFSYGNTYDSNEMPDGIIFARIRDGVPPSVDITAPKPIIENLVAARETENADHGVTYMGSAAMGTIRIPTSIRDGKEFSIIAGAGGAKVMGFGTSISNLGAASSDWGAIQSDDEGASLKGKMVNGVFTAIATQGTWNVLDLTGSTLINAIDVGRVAGGTVSGWEQDTLFTGGSDSNWSAYTADLSMCDTPAPNAVYETFRNAHTSFDYDWTGLDNTKAHVVRLHIVEGNAGAVITEEGVIDITINGRVVEQNFSFFPYGVQTVAILEYRVPAGTTTINVDVSGPAASFAAKLSGIELYELV